MLPSVGCAVSTWCQSRRSVRPGRWASVTAAAPSPGEPEPTNYWLSTLPADVRLRDLVRLAKIRRRIEHDYRELKDGLGLDHFEGRS